jgi:hypothetical protein
MVDPSWQSSPRAMTAKIVEYSRRLRQEVAAVAWSNSKIFRSMLADVLGNVAAFDFDADSFKVALYDNDITPDANVTSANTAYNVGQWVSALNEVFEAVTWPQGGVALSGQTLNSVTSDVVFFDAADTASGAGVDLANVFGCLVYDDTLAAPVADQGVSFNYFGGSNSVVNGTFTVAWNALGIFRYTHT